MEASRPRPEILEKYSGYSPPYDVKSSVSRMLETIPPERLVGLGSVVLTNKASLTRKRRRAITWARKRKVRIADVAGLYHPHWKNEAAWIEVFVDEVLGAWQKRWWLKVSFWREILVSDVLFHEMGHHIHATSRPEFRERETVAEEWRARLSGRFFRSEYPWLMVLSYPVKAVRRTLRSMSRDRRSHKENTDW